MESAVGLDGNAYYGFDRVELGYGAPTLLNQLVAGIATNDFWLGSLGLSALAFNISDFTDPIPSLLSNLKNHSAIASKH